MILTNAKLKRIPVLNEVVNEIELNPNLTLYLCIANNETARQNIGIVQITKAFINKGTFIN
jgi:hypothetical protein